MFPVKKFRNLFAIFGCNVLKGNGLSKLLSVFLGPLMLIINGPKNTVQVFIMPDSETIPNVKEGKIVT